MRILFVTDSTLAETRGGAEVSAFQLALGLVESGHEVFLATRRRGRAVEEDHLSGVFAAAKLSIPTARGYLETGFAGAAALSRLLVKVAREYDFDMVHAHNWVSAYAAHLAKHAMGRVAKCPWLLSVRDYRFLCPSTYGWCFSHDAGCGLVTSARCIARHTTASRPVRAVGLVPYSIFRNATWRMSTKSLSSFDGFVACSEFLKARFRLAYPRIAQVFAVHNPVEIPTSFTGEGGDGEILYAGRLSVEKGVLCLISAFESVLRRRPGARLTLLGAGPLEQKLRETCGKDGGLGNSVRVVGHVPPGEVPGYYARASLAVCPSIWPEPFGRVPLESMAAGRPVVASRTGGIPEVVEDGRTGILVEPGDPESLADALTHVLSHRTEMIRLGRRGCERARNRFSRRIIASRFEGLYSQVSRTL